MKHILISNDDSYSAKGLLALVEALRPLARVTVVAPATEKSACGHSLTLTRPLRFIAIDDDFYKLDDGTPSDCVYLALHSMFEDQKPDLVISGINHGANMGEDITYSGTASAAMEAVLHGIPAIAISQVVQNGDWNNLDFSLAQEAITTLVAKIFEGEFPLPERQFLNVNVPTIQKFDSLQMKVTYGAYRLYGNDAHMHRNPRGEEHYWLGLHPLQWENRDIERMSDFDAVFAGYVSVTPIQLDLSAYFSMKRLDEWI
jgi:5'-nucleotidase